MVHFPKINIRLDCKQMDYLATVHLSPQRTNHKYECFRPTGQVAQEYRAHYLAND